MIQLSYGVTDRNAEIDELRHKITERFHLRDKVRLESRGLLQKIFQTLCEFPDVHISKSLNAREGVNSHLDKVFAPLH